MDDLRKPFFIAALILMLMVVLIEIGSGLTLRGAAPALNAAPPDDVMSKITGAPLPPAIQQALGGIANDPDSKSAVASLSDSSHDIPGYGIPYMAILDGMLLFTVGLVGASLIFTDRIEGRIQGIVSLILAIIMILASIAMIILAIVFLILMISLLLAIPFGTIVYLAIYGFFNRGGASATLSLLMTLKIVFAICLVIAQQRFLQNRGLVLLVISSLIANIVISFLQGFVPGILVSITDDIAGIVVAVCGCVWWLLALIAAIPAILNTIRARV